MTIEDKQTTDTIAEAVVDVLVADFTNRRGLRQEWENIDPDIQQEIVDTWTAIVREGLIDQARLHGRAS